MSLVTNNKISWDQFTELLTPTNPNRAETIFDNFNDEVETVLAFQSHKKKESEATGTISSRDVILAHTVKNYIRRIDFGSLYQNGKVDLDKINQITSDKKRISSFLQSIIMRLGTLESFGFVADHVSSALNGKIYSLYSAGKAQIGTEAKERAEILATKLFQGPLVDTAIATKGRDAATAKKETFKHWLIPIETRIGEMALAIMKSQIQDDESQQDDRMALTAQERDNHPDIDFQKLRNVPLTIVREWIQITDDFIRPLAELERKASLLRPPRNLLEWNNTFNTVNEWVTDVQNKKTPQRERPLSIMLDIPGPSSSDPFLHSPATPFNPPSSTDERIPFKYFVSSLTAETLIQLETQKRPPDIVFQKPSELVKPYVLEKLTEEKKALEATVQNLCNNKDPLNEAAASLGVELESSSPELSLRQKKYAQNTLLAHINKKIVKEVSEAFKIQKEALIVEAKKVFDAKFSEKGTPSNIEALWISLKRVQDKVIDMYKTMRTIEDFDRATQMNKYFENSILAHIYKEAMAEGPMEETRFSHWIRKVKGIEAEFLQAK